MIKEDRVTFEIAKLLRDKGFPQNTFEIDCNVCYKYNGNLCNNAKSMFGVDREISYMAPTLQMAMKWLREVFNIFIEIGTSIDLNGKYHFNYTILDKECKYVKRGYTDFDWDYKQTCEAAIKYCLNNLI